MSFLDEWENEVRAGLSQLPPVSGKWRGTPLFQQRLYGVYHKEGEPFSGLLTHANVSPDKTLLITMYGAESDTECLGVDRLFVSDLNVLKSTLLATSSLYDAIMIGPASALRHTNGDPALLELKLWCLDTHAVACSLFVYHSAESLDINSHDWLSMVQHCEAILK